MSKKTEYKSAQRSRKMIRHAFVSLSLEKEVDKITVKSIIDRAEISRGTFYAHYSDIYAIIEEIQNEFMEGMTSALKNYTGLELLKNPMPFLSDLARLLEQDIEFYRMLVQIKAVESFLVTIKEMLIEKILSCEELHRVTTPNVDFKLRVNFFMSGWFSIYQDWFNGKLDCSLQALSESINQMMVQAFQPFFSSSP